MTASGSVVFVDLEGGRGAKIAFRLRLDRREVHGLVFPFLFLLLMIRGCRAAYV